MKTKHILPVLLTLLLLLSILAGCTAKNTGDADTDAAENTAQVTPEDDAQASASNAVQINNSDAVGVVTAIDGTKVSYTLYTSDNKEKITDYTTVDTSKYTALDITADVDVSTCLLNMSSQGDWQECTVEDIQVGDWIIVTYDLDSQNLVGVIVLR